MTQVKINCKDAEAAKQFLEWLSGQGESDLSMWADENGPEHSRIKYDMDKLEATLED